MSISLTSLIITGCFRGRPGLSLVRFVGSAVVLVAEKAQLA